MGKKWERLAGNTSQFAIKLAFSDDPDEGQGADPDEARSWGSFQIWASDVNLCSQHFGGETIESVHWYLLPLLEWLVGNWDPLFHEERLPNRNVAPTASWTLDQTKEPPIALSGSEVENWDGTWYAWWCRHNLQAARVGGLFPSVYFRRWRDRLEVSWSLDGNLELYEPKFLTSDGVVRLELDAVAGPLYKVLDEACAYLLSEAPDSARLQQLKRATAALQGPREERRAWLLGLGTSLQEMSDAWHQLRQALRDFPRDAIDAVFGRTPSEGLVLRPIPAALMFGAAAPNLSMSDRVDLTAQLVEAYARRQPARIDDLSLEAPVDAREAWTQGYELAEFTLERLRVDDSQPAPIDIESILRELGVLRVDVTLRDSDIRAVAIGGNEFHSTILLNRSHVNYRYPTGRRFSLAHELCHLLYDRSFARNVALPTGPWAPRDVEQRANAFAAMFLMPLGRLERAIAESTAEMGTKQLVVDVAATLGTSFTATLEHLHNLGLIGEEERDELREQASH